MKSYKNQNQLLDDSIAALRLQKHIEKEDFKYQYGQLIDSLKPSNIINQSLLNVATAPQLRVNLKSSLISLVGGYLSKKLVVGKSKSLFRNILGFVLQSGITSYIASKVSSKLRG